ncbi:MAG TPA: DNRLRE domain-containing protein [Candidatus Nanoarchaeia archaeon]|nr:DNRLRE domain-containing protein [Candidatus Nanoarchaeia archaeon]
MLIIAFLAVTISVLLINPQITGRFFGESVEFSQSIGKNFTSSEIVELQISDILVFNLQSFKVSGSFSEDTEAKVYLKTTNQSFLVFDTSEFEKQQALPDTVTGFFTGEEKEEKKEEKAEEKEAKDEAKEEKKEEKKAETAEPAPQPSSGTSTDVIGSPESDTTSGSDAGAESAPIEESPSTEVPAEETPKEEENLTIPEEITPEENITAPAEENATAPAEENLTIPLEIPQQAIAFSSECLETCLLPEGISEENYTLEIEISSGELLISDLTYTLLDLTEIPVNVTIVIVDSSGSPVDANITLLDEAGVEIESAGESLIENIFIPEDISQPATGSSESFEVLPSDENNLLVYITEELPIQSIEFTNIRATEDIVAVIGVDDVPETIVPEVNGLPTAEVYAIDPTQLDFATATVAVTASPDANALYKCADWIFETQECPSGNWTFVQTITPGENYQINITSTDPAFSETQQPNGAGKDTYIQGAFNDRNQGAQADIEVKSASTDERAMIQFDLSNITSTATITSAVLTLYREGGADQNPVNISIYRMTTAWDEGTGTGSQTNNGATWNNATNTSTWTTQGGDYDTATEFARTAVNGNGYYTWNVAPLVQGWVNGTWSNRGLMLANTIDGDSRKIFTSSEGTNTTNRPKLVVNYTTALNVTFVSPTPANGSTVAANFVFVNVSLANGNATEAKLEWNGTNYTMSNATALPSNNWYVNRTGLTTANYTYKAYANDSGTKVFDVSETRVVTVNADLTPPYSVTFINPTPANNSVTINNITITINVKDAVGVGSCTLEFDGANESMSIAGPGGTDVDCTINKASLSVGTHTFRVYGTDTSSNTNVSETRVITVDNGFPQFASLTESPSDPATYSSTAGYVFNATVTDNTGLGTVILEFDGANYTSFNTSGSVYSKTFGPLAAATYTYKWHANDTAGNRNSTANQTYTVDKAVTALSINLNPSGSITYGTESNVTCTANNPESVAAITRNSASVSNPDIQTLAAGTYSYACTSAATQNYTSGSDTETLTVSKASPTVNLTLNGQHSDLSVDTGTAVNITATLVTPSSGNLNLTEDSVLINSGASPLTNLTTYNLADTFVLNATYNGNENYSAGSKTRTLTVSTPSAGGGGSSGSGGGGGGGGGAAAAVNACPISTPQTITLGLGVPYGCRLSDGPHSIRLSGIFTDAIELTIQSEPFKAQFRVNETKLFDLTGDGISDVEITALSKTDNTVNLRVTFFGEPAREMPAEQVAVGPSLEIPPSPFEPILGSAVQVKPFRGPNPLYAVPTLLLLILLFAILALRHEKISPGIKRILTAMHILLIGAIGILLLLTFAGPAIVGAASAVAVSFLGLNLKLYNIVLIFVLFIIGISIPVIMHALQHRRALKNEQKPAKKSYR